MASEKKKITIAIFFVLIFTFSALIAYEKIADPSHANDRKREHSLMQNGYLTGDEFFSANFSNSNTVFLIGSSHLGSANVTSINDIISSSHEKSDRTISVYNLAAFGDSPSNRIETFNEIISTSPKVIFYQISYRDFQFTYEERKDLIPINFKDMFYSNFGSLIANHIPVNPQELIFSLLRPIQNSFAPSLEDPITTNDKTPFYHYTKFRTKSFDDLKAEISPVTDWKNHNLANKNMEALKQMIDLAKKNDIKLVIVTSPLHELYLETLSEKQKDDFSSLLNTLEKNYELKIYDFENKYGELNVWGNISHISYNKEVTIYNQDIAKMILEET